MSSVSSTKNNFLFLRNKSKQVINITVYMTFFLLIFLPFYESFFRAVAKGFLPSIPGSIEINRHLTMFVAFLGSFIAATKGSLITLTKESCFSPDSPDSPARTISKTVALIIIGSLAFASYRVYAEEPEKIFFWILSVKTFLAIMPIGFALIFALWFFRLGSLPNYLIVGSTLLVVYALSSFPTFSVAYEWLQGSKLIFYIALGLIFFSVLNGMPIFCVLGGLSVLFFWHNGTPIAAVSAEIYRMVASALLPSLALFAFAGYLLAESKASVRLLEVCRSTLGWLPGGLPVIACLFSGFFSAMTGGSGVAILAVGGVFYPLLRKEGYSESFALGLVTISGSIGLLFPPSLPLIIYGVNGSKYLGAYAIEDLFWAGLIPGLFMIFLVSLWVIFQTRKEHIAKHKFSVKGSLSAIWGGKWEVLIPPLVLFLIFSSYATLVEASAILVIYILSVEAFVYKDLTWKKISQIVLDSASLIGGILMILGVSLGFSSYLVEAQIPEKFLKFMSSFVESKYVFLLMLNICLIIAGAFMDIFSAIIILLPLIAPLGSHYGVHPLHLAIIFIANLELGYITPPVGLNLFFSAYRFKKPLTTVYKAAVPFFLVGLAAVFLITYIPYIALWLPNLVVGAK